MHLHADYVCPNFKKILYIMYPVQHDLRPCHDNIILCICHHGLALYSDEGDE